jgi:VIT1/CCC1 family predicted Fe2+/Mn2+ transporter
MRAAEERARVLNPVDRVSEIIFGLLMALSFTGSISVATAGREEVRVMMAAALGCNLAWGMADAVMYLIAMVVTRARAAKLLVNLRATTNAAAGQELIANSLEWPLAAVADAPALETIRQRLLTDTVPGHRLIDGDDLLGALGVFLLVVVATLPVVIPFALVTPTMVALRISNLIALIMLFVSGWMLARHAGLSTWLGGLVMALVGSLMVGTIVALGG